MARDYAKTNLTIWQDPEWRALPWPAQHVYKMFWEHPGLSYCGVVDWRPTKMLGWGDGWNRADLMALVDCLRARHFLVVDEDTEECLVRSWIRFDGVIKQPRLTVSMCNAFGEVGSNDLRGVIVDELHKLKERDPNAAGWAKPQTKDILGFPAVSAKDLTVPTDPFGTGFGIALGSVSVPVSEAFGPNYGSGFGTGLGTPYNSNSTITTAPLHPGASDEVVGEDAATPPKDSGKKRASKLPDDWEPTDAHKSRAVQDGINLAAEVSKFKAHAEANDRRQANWNAAFTQWLLNVPEWHRSAPTVGGTFPTNGTEAEKDAWVKAQPLPADGAYYGGSARR
ncbi:MAG TPA: hypothetical protein VFG63_11760 [Nocardioidaceae bacterium]|nr:hypothetical protein [Nocardioidaceae bacterium]